MTTKYAMLARTSRLQSVASTEELEEASTELQNFTVAAGTLIKVASEPSAPTHNLQVFVYDPVLREPNTTRIYQCAQDSLLPVSDDLWPFIVSIPEPNRRLQLVQDSSRCNWLYTAMPGDVVSVPARYFDRDDFRLFDCIICYIGPVPEIHPVGYFFGLELLDDVQSPQAADISFTRKYFACDADAAIFITADRILPTPSSQDEEIESANEAPENSWSFTNFIQNTVDSIRASLPL
ncbi:uncharacterized protein LOC126757992 [Bactrocera neohumeralis]|uniref:uncharacterized protein LOC126757992 n=1 Tax=Bactrocera neohumeralis TaxID=98809 RepID=UPI0021655166|nr:uncharacterized protein LOC126757992 [Bactrocera neohumeralis]